MTAAVVAVPIVAGCVAFTAYACRLACSGSAGVTPTTSAGERQGDRRRLRIGVRPHPADPIPPPPRMRGWLLAQALGDPHMRHTRLMVGLALAGNVARPRHAYTPREARHLVTPTAVAKRVRAIHAAAVQRGARQIGTTS